MRTVSKYGVCAHLLTVDARSKPETSGGCNLYRDLSPEVREVRSQGSLLEVIDIGRPATRRETMMLSSISNG